LNKPDLDFLFDFWGQYENQKATGELLINPDVFSFMVLKQCTLFSCMAPVDTSLQKMRTWMFWIVGIAKPGSMWKKNQSH